MHGNGGRRIHPWCVVGDAIHVAFAPRDVEGARVVKGLGDDGELLLAEDAVGTHHAVQCAKAGVVAVDAVGRHTHRA